MSNSKDFVKIQMYEHDYQKLNSEIRESMELMAVDVSGFDYSFDELHQELKKKSNKAYKDLKKREYELRHGKTK